MKKKGQRSRRINTSLERRRCSMKIIQRRWGSCHRGDRSNGCAFNFLFLFLFFLRCLAVLSGSLPKTDFVGLNRSLMILSDCDRTYQMKYEKELDGRLTCSSVMIPTLIVRCNIPMIMRVIRFCLAHCMRLGCARRLAPFSSSSFLLHTRTLYSTPSRTVLLT